MDLVWIKLILTPLAITAIALAGRRWGPAVGGWIAGLPLTSGPVSLYLALEQGRTFAATAAVNPLASGAAVGGVLPGLCRGSFTRGVDSQYRLWVIGLFLRRRPVGVSAAVVVADLRRRDHPARRGTVPPSGPRSRVR